MLLPKPFGALVLIALAATCTAHVPGPVDPAIERRVNELVAKMTLEEKLGQMSLDAFHRSTLTDDQTKRIKAGQLGALYGGVPASTRAKAQEVALHETRLHIPLMFGLDIIHGYATQFPIPLAQAATWDPALVGQAARIAAVEATSVGIDWDFSPMVDIARDPRWGRIAEGYGEDPVLGAAMAAATVKGYQGPKLSDPTSMVACAKHYVAYGAAEAGRDYNSTWVPEAQLREIYLPPFHAAVDAGAQTLMSAFNAINGVPASGNAFTLRQILRREWGFTGFVVSDYASIMQMIAHGYAADNLDAAKKGIEGGVDMEMVTRTYAAFGQYLHTHKPTQAEMRLIDDLVRDILRVKFRMGLFDGRPQPANTEPPQASPASLAVAQSLAAESLVLLKNESGLLPLNRNLGTVAVIGPLADNKEAQNGTWGSGVFDATVTPLAALRRTLGADHVIYASGLKSAEDTSTDGFGAAVEAARKSDVVLVIVGEESWMSGEAASHAHLELEGAQNALIEAVKKVGKPTVGVIIAGRPLALRDTTRNLDALIYAWSPGAMGGPAISDAVFGVTCPSGKLPATFPRAVGQVPLYYNHLNTGRPALAERGERGDDYFTSKYQDELYTPEYPFGFGLSYTTFGYSNLKVDEAPMKPMQGELKVSADVKNTGSVEADEVVQLYAHQRYGSVARPVKELKAFRRIHLKPGQTERVRFAIPASALAYYNPQMRLVSEPSRFDVWIAPNSVTGLHGEFEIVAK